LFSKSGIGNPRAPAGAFFLVQRYENPALR
jgi:hypothetical protein